MSTSTMRSALVCAAAVGLSFGFLDASYVLLSRGHELDRLSAIAPGVLALATVSFAACAALVLIARTALRRTGADTAGIASAVVLILFAVLIALEKPISMSLAFDPARGGSPRQADAVIALGTSLLVALGAVLAYGATRHLRSRGGIPAAATAAFLVPVLLGELTLALWALKAHPSLRLRGAALLFLAAASATMLLARGRSGRARVERLVLATPAVLVLASLAAWMPGSERAEAAPSRRHALRRIVLISVDTLRADALGSAGSGARTPALDRFAAESVVFTKAISPAPWTLPSLASILTGVSPAVHDFHLYTKTPFSGGSQSWLRIPTLAERTREAGYRSAAFIANPIIVPETNITRGFETCLVTPQPGGPDTRSLGGRLIRRPVLGALPPGKSARLLTSVAERWVEKNASEDFFLWVHYFDPHLPYTLPRDLHPAIARPPSIDPDTGGPGLARDPADLAWRRTMYAAEVRYTDEGIGKLLDTLRRLKIYDDALVIVTSDHGEGFLEHGLLRHANSLYQELLHVPLLVKLPGRGAPRVVGTPVDTTSIAPTVLELGGLRGWEASTSPSLVPLLGGAAPESWPPIVSTGVTPEEERESVVLGDWKYILAPASGAEVLYDLSRDPGERAPILAPSLPERFGAARAALRDHHERAARLRRITPKDTGTADRDRETIQRLKALGYIQ